MAYQVGVDLGTTWTAVAVCRSGGPAEMVPLGDRAPAVPSVAFIGDDGDFAVGETAERHAATEPARVVEEFTRRIGDRTPIVVNGEPIAAEALAARFVGHLLQRVATREGGPATGVALTHPAGWGPHKLGLLRSGLAEHGLRGVLLLPEAQAAAIGYASAARVPPGGVIAVYDLGGGTFDAAVLRTSERSGGFELLGSPEGIDGLGGVDFDEAVFEHVQTELGAAWDALDPTDDMVLAAVRGLRRECVAAKEALSQDTEVSIPVTLPDLHRVVRLDRARFEEMIRPAVEETVAALGRAIASAGLPGGVVPTIVLAGGSSRIPLVRATVERELGLPIAVDVDPKGVIAVGTALAARDATPTIPPSAAVSPPAADAHHGEPHDEPRLRPELVPPPVGVRPFHQPDTARPRRRLPMLIGSVAAGVLALAIGGSLLASVTQVPPVTPAGSTAEASTPASRLPSAPTVAPPADAPPADAPPARRARPPEQAPPEVRRTAVVPTPAPATTTTAPSAEPTPAPEATTEPPEETTAPASGDGDDGEAPAGAADPDAADPDAESTAGTEEGTDAAPTTAG
jgi:molecular chaperone DnaK